MSFRGSSKRDHTLTECRQSSADLEMLDRTIKITQCKLINGHNEIRQPCLETRKSNKKQFINSTLFKHFPD